jgi:hypothetical protein
VDDYNDFIAVLPNKTRKIIYELLKVSDSKTKTIKSKSSDGSYELDVKNYFFNEEKIYKQNGLLEDYVNLDRELLKYFLIRIASHPEYYEKDGVERYFYDTLLPYFRIMKPMKGKDSINLTFSVSGKRNVFQNTKSNTYIYFLGDDSPANADIFIEFEINDYSKTLTPIKYYNSFEKDERKKKDLLLARYEFSKRVVSYIGNEEFELKIEKDKDFVMKSMLALINTLNQLI